MSIHPTAIISSEAIIDDGVTIGPYVVIQGKVKIGKGTRIESHACIGSQFGVVEIGENNHILQSAAVGGPPQDLSYKNENTKLVVGNNNVIREFVTLNIGTQKDKGVTKIGNDCLLMTYVHIAHDCQLGDRVVIANSTHFAGHVKLEDDVKVGGGCLFNQFVRVGKHAYIAGDTTVRKDVLPFTMVHAQGGDGVMRATNKIGLQRAGFEKEDIENVHRAMRAILKGDRTLEEALEKIERDCAPTGGVEYLKQFVTGITRGLAK